MTRGIVIGLAGGVLGFAVGLGVIVVAIGSGDTPYALVDGSIAAAAAALGVWAASTARSAPRRASTTLLLAGIVGFLVIGIVWIVGGGPMIAGAFMIRSHVFGTAEHASVEVDDA